MRLSELKGNLPFTKRYRTENGINAFKCGLRELQEGEVYDMIIRYRCFIRDGLYVETSYSFSGNDLNELLSEKRNALELFEELRIVDGISDEEFNKLVEMKKQYCEDVYIVCTDDTMPSESKLAMSRNYMSDNFRVRQLYEHFVNEIKFNDFNKLQSYTITLNNFGMPIIMREILNNEFDENGNLIRSEMNTFNTNKEVTECAYDEYNRMILKKYILNDELIYVDKYRYDGNLRYCDMITPDGKLETHDIALMDDGLPILQTSSAISKYGTTEGITTFDYLENGDVMIDSITITPSEVVEL
mgnify:CR=1 FL=1